MYIRRSQLDIPIRHHLTTAATIPVSSVAREDLVIFHRCSLFLSTPRSPSNSAWCRAGDFRVVLGLWFREYHGKLWPDIFYTNSTSIDPGDLPART